MRPKAAGLVFLLIAGITIVCFSQSFIVTDASGGIFNTDQKITFANAGTGWFRLLLDEREIYRGRGPAFPELGIPQGEERGFMLRFEYYSNGNVLLESGAFSIYIDKRPPSLSDPEINNSPQGLRLTNNGGEPNVMIRSWADVDGELTFFPDLGNGVRLPADSFPAVVWAEDMAGNYSAPRSEYVNVSLVAIENPAPGEWSNPQTLIISGAEGKNIRWTCDGSDPLKEGGSGRLYRGPERIEKRGQITLRIAWQEASGKVREDRVEYSVTANAFANVERSLDIFRITEERELRSVITLPVPESCSWFTGSVPQMQRGETITLRPLPLVRRVVAVQLLPEGAGIYRFVYLLDGSGNDPHTSIPVLPPQGSAFEDGVLYPGSGEAAGTGSINAQVYPFPPLALITAGRSRVVDWPRVQGTLYFSWQGVHTVQGAWQEAKSPLLIPIEGGTIRWFVRDASAGEGWRLEPEVSGYYSAFIPSAAGIRDNRVRGRFAYRSFTENGSQNWIYVSDLIEYLPEIAGRSILLDACDGEDLEWAFISTSGKILEQKRRDRQAPPEPVIAAPEMGGWVRGPIRVSAFPGESDTSVFLNARINYASGITQMINGEGFLDIVSALGEIAEVTVEAVQVDASGNSGPKAVRHFTLDPKTVYASAAFPMAGNTHSPRGDRDNPFTSLDEAIDHALKYDLGVVRISGSMELKGPVPVSRNLHIEGAWRESSAIGTDETIYKAAILPGNGVYWDVHPGIILSLSGVTVERNGGDNSLFYAGRNSNLDISNTMISTAGPVLRMDGGVCRIRDSDISVRISGDERKAAFSARDSGIDIKNSRMQIEANYGLLFEIEGGIMAAENSILLAAGKRTSSVLTLGGSRGRFFNLTSQAAAEDYASVMEVTSSELFMEGGIISVSARDCSAIVLNSSAGIISEAQIRVDGSSSARAFEIKGAYPIVSNSLLYSEGDAKKAEVFSGSSFPPPGLEGNRILGFTRLWGELLPGETVD